jgi:hypothetical protein
MRLGNSLKSYSPLLTNGNTNMAGGQTCDVGPILAPLAAGSYSIVTLEIFEKYRTLVQQFFVQWNITIWMLHERKKYCHDQDSITSLHEYLSSVLTRLVRHWCRFKTQGIETTWSVYLDTNAKFSNWRNLSLIIYNFQRTRVLVALCTHRWRLQTQKRLLTYV